MRLWSSLFLLLTGCVIVGTGEDETAKDLRTEAIRQVVLRDSKKLLGCYDYELKKSPATAEGKVIMSWDVDADGHAQNISADPNSTLKIETLNRCLSDELRELSFPPPRKGDNLHIKFPFVFKHEGSK